jgi:uncharacterized protein (TIGR03435 family)
MRALGWMLVLLCGQAVAPPKTADTRPEFEVATIRRSPPNAADGSWSLPDSGRFDGHALPLSLLLQLAYGVPAREIVGVPGWAQTTLYDIAAKPEAGVKLSREELRPRLQRLLEERLGLMVHWEDRTEAVYFLRVDKAGVKMPVSDGHTRTDWRKTVDAGDAVGSNWSTSFLAQQLTSAAGRPVVDATGLMTRYDVDLHYAADAEGENDKPDLLTAVQKQLGLRLEAGHAPVKVLVVERVSMEPAAD